MGPDAIALYKNLKYHIAIVTIFNVSLLQPHNTRELFESHVYNLLVSRELIDPDLIAKMRTWKHSGFHVYVRPAIPQKEDAVRVGLYIVRAPASASRLQLTEDGLLKYLASLRGRVVAAFCRARRVRNPMGHAAP
jgi:hypothetical protein